MITKEKQGERKKWLTAEKEILIGILIAACIAWALTMGMLHWLFNMTYHSGWIYFAPLIIWAVILLIVIMLYIFPEIKPKKEPRVN